MPLHNVKPSTTFLIRNYFVADCVAHRSHEPAKTDSMDLGPRPGTRQPWSAEIHGRNALLIALAINEGQASTTQYPAAFRLAPRSVSWRCSPFNPSPLRTSTRLANELARGASLGVPSLHVKEIGLRFTNLTLPIRSLRDVLVIGAHHSRVDQAKKQLDTGEIKRRVAREISQLEQHDRVP